MFLIMFIVLKLLGTNMNLFAAKNVFISFENMNFRQCYSGFQKCFVPGVNVQKFFK